MARQPNGRASLLKTEPKGGCEAGLGSLFEDQVRLNGTASAIESDGHALSYAELRAKSLSLACQVQALGLLDNSPVGILISRGINHILAQLASVYAGRACVPLDTKLSDDSLKSMLDNLHARFILTDQGNAHRLNLRDPVSNCSHVFHTSGTSGRPKDVPMPASGLINLCRDPDANWIKRGQRVGHAASVVFDISLVEIWGSLLNGATIVVIPMETVLDPLELSNFIRIHHLDVLQLTTSVLDVTTYACPGAFATLDTVITEGEAINCQSIRSIFSSEGGPRRIINGYGPTECSVYCLWHCVSRLEAQQGNIPVGKPFRNVETFPVDEALMPVGVGELGELLVAGAGVASGYSGEVRKMDSSFIAYNPQLCRDGFSKMGTRRVYRTGDLMRRDERGRHYYIGRKDNQVKISGQRETDLVSAATVIKITPQELGRSAFQVACCVPKFAHVTAAAILDHYVGRHPRLVVPRLKLMESLPLKTNGKVDRDQLLRQYTRETESSHAKGRKRGSLAAELRYLWLDVLGIPDKDLQPSDDFISMGGNSPMVASLIARINHSFGISLSASTLYDKMTLEDLTQLLTTLHRHSQPELPIHANEEDEWLRDSHLGQHLRPSREGPVVTDWTAASEGKVFHTGATGFVRAFFLAALLLRPFVKQVCCLVRAHDQAHGRVRLQKTLLKYQLYPPNLDRLIIIPGSFGETRLGLDTQQYDHYAEWASVVFHLEAKVNYLATYSAHRTDNVLGTVHMLEFATHKRTKPIHYTSTIAAYGPTGHVLATKFLPEDERPAPAHMASLHYDTGYAQSQFVAETIAWRAIDSGLPLAIYRPGFVLGHSRMGVVNRDDFISRLFASCLVMGAYPVLPRQRKEFVPVDFVVDALLHISVSSSSSGNRDLGHAFNLVHPDPTSAIDVCAAFALLNQISPSPSPRPMRGVPFSEWVRSLSLRPEDPLYPPVPMLREKVLGDRTRWEVYEDMAEYGRGNLRSALRKLPGILDCTPMDRLFERCLGNWLVVLNDK
ncbi:non-ribosomal peptide synthetase [Aspergillus keveii]|uniref:Non-ribosomal peptide synthetase n=1 Tax=Aspergillus keveii TaxID=714993 RepID=A0ABR4FRZ5_9EURO